MLPLRPTCTASRGSSRPPLRKYALSSPAAGGARLHAHWSTAEERPGERATAQQQRQPGGGLASRLAHTTQSLLQWLDEFVLYPWDPRCVGAPQRPAAAVGARLPAGCRCR